MLVKVSSVLYYMGSGARGLVAGALLVRAGIGSIGCFVLDVFCVALTRLQIDSKKLFKTEIVVF